MKSVSSWLGVLCAISLIVASACSDDDGPAGETGGAGDGGSDDTSGSGGGPASGGAASGGAAGKAGVGEGEGGRPLCIADFPCDERDAECVGGSRIQALRTVSCREVCPPGPCSGGSCLPDGEARDCPAGTSCRELRVSLNGYTAVCDDGNGGSGGNQDFEPCGNGLRESGEACDDGNRLAGDGCNANCAVEPNWVCPPNEPCQSLLVDEPCEDACWDQDACLENASHSTCECPEERPSGCEDVRFRTLQRLEGNTGCNARALSGDGTIVIGDCSWQAQDSSGFESTAAVWSLGEGVSEFGDASGELLTAVSTDGSVIVGMDDQSRGLRWLDGEAELLAADFLPWAVNADGSAVVGYSTDQQPMVWIDGETTVLTGPDGETEGNVLGVNPAADTFVGYVRSDQHSRAVRWNAAGVAEALPVPDAATESEAAALNDDGSVIVGTLWYGSDTQAVRWTSTGYEPLEAPPPSSAYFVSADGARVLGDAGNALWVWDGDGTSQSLGELAGVDTGYWLLNGSAGISADGKTVAGSAQYIAEDRLSHAPRPFVAFLP